jgi:hypothetical protein
MMSRPVLEPTQWVPEALRPEVQRLSRENNQPPPLISRVKNDAAKFYFLIYLQRVVLN